MAIVFVAYPSDPAAIGQTIEIAATRSRQGYGSREITTWKRPDLAGGPLIQPILESIEKSELVVADVTVLNFNVTYELGYSIGIGKRVLPVKYRAINSDNGELQKIGIFDTLLYQEYDNADDLLKTINSADTARRFATDFPLDPAPVYTILPSTKTEDIIHLLGRVRKSGLRYRSFDPTEQPRLSVSEAVRAVAASQGVLLPLLGPEMSETRIHNIRVAFVAGLSHGMQKANLLLQNGPWPTPLDVRDDVVVYQTLNQVNGPIQEFVDRVIEARYASPQLGVGEQSYLAKLNLGDPTAENEFMQLGNYFLERDEFRQVLQGRVNIVVGRKGAGKTAMFAQVRDRLRSHRAKIIVDLNPEAYQLRKFKDLVLKFLSEGSKEHLLTAFWEYLILLEVCGKIIEKDQDIHKRNHNLYEPYQRLLRLYRAERAMEGTDFSERLLRLVEAIGDRYMALGEEKSVYLAENRLTNLLYETDLFELTAEIEAYAQHKDGIIVLVDNLDKGWNATGLEEADVVMIRSLLDAGRKLQRAFGKNETEFHSVIFLRNDVYELLLSGTPDRGKETRALVDWTQPELLKQLIRRRLIFNGMDKAMPVDALWYRICVPTVNGEDSLNYLIERSLMRPRYLLRLINHCKSSAVNFSNERMEEEDIERGLSTYSTDVVTEVDHEIRDVMPGAEDILYQFLGEPREMHRSKILQLIKSRVSSDVMSEQVFVMLLWHGVVGFRRPNGPPAFIHDVNYDLKRLVTLMTKTGGDDPVTLINPAFWSGLEMT